MGQTKTVLPESLSNQSFGLQSFFKGASDKWWRVAGRRRGCSSDTKIDVAADDTDLVVFTAPRPRLLHVRAPFSGCGGGATGRLRNDIRLALSPTPTITFTFA